ncbi:MAG: ankyrin repeat domain-containing protein [Candidatus Methylacidiphilales bacterium]|nr:ankyrin repeat domain-containing protein [Candidatus Methylacidiphilales bacterium]
MNNETVVSDFCLAVANREFDEAQRLLAQGHPIEEKNEYGNTPLMWVTYLGYVESVRWLLEQGADVNGRNQQRQTALHEAASCHKTECLKVLVAAGANLNAKDMAGDTPAHWAARLGAVGCLAALAESGANLGLRNYTGAAPLHEVFHFGVQLTAMVEVFARCGADLNLPDSYGRTALHIAAHRANTEGVTCLLDSGASPFAVDREGNTPLHLAGPPHLKELLLSVPGARQGYCALLLAGGKPYDFETHGLINRT